MTHDIEDLLNLIKELEERVLVLEEFSGLQAEFIRNEGLLGPDSWYWDH